MSNIPTESVIERLNRWAGESHVVSAGPLPVWRHEVPEVAQYIASLALDQKKISVMIIERSILAGTARFAGARLEVRD